MLGRLLGHSLVLTCLSTVIALPGAALPDPADIPEEVLRHQEQSLIGRSPVDNTELEQEAYEALMTELAAAQTRPSQLAPELQQTILLLQMLKLVRNVSPF